MVWQYFVLTLYPVVISEKQNLYLSVHTFPKIKKKKSEIIPPTFTKATIVSYFPNKPIKFLSRSMLEHT